MNLYVVTVPFAVQMNLACKNELKNLCFSPTVSYLCYLTLHITIHAILSAITCHASCRMQTKEGKTVPKFSPLLGSNFLNVLFWHKTSNYCDKFDWHWLCCIPITGFVLFLCLGILTMLRPNMYFMAPLQEKVVFGMFFLGAVLCLSFSWLFHTVYCHSEKVSRTFSK